MHIEDIRVRLDGILTLLESQKREIELLCQLLGDTDYYINKLKSEEWPQAADPIFICNRESDEDKMARASAIYSLFLSSRLAPPSRFLDFGCGSGHVAKYARDSGVGVVVGYDICADNY